MNQRDTASASEANRQNMPFIELNSPPSTFTPQRPLASNVKRSFAFTLVELLVVIAIMAVLMGLIVWGTTTAMTKAKRSRVQAEMLQIQTAIDSYQSKLGYYPPDNGNPTNHATPPLLYELVGTVNTATGYKTLGISEEIEKATIKSYFNRDGFQNANADQNEVENFFKTIKAKQYAMVSTSPDVDLLVVPVEGPEYKDPVSGAVVNINPWRYKRNGPRNPGKYDLWAEIIVGGKTNIIGNWKE